MVVTGDVDLLAASAKILQEPSLAYGEVTKPNFDELTDEQAKQKEEGMKTERRQIQHRVEGGLIIGAPALFALLGLVLWRLREAKRNRVQLA